MVIALKDCLFPAKAPVIDKIAEAIPRMPIDVVNIIALYVVRDAAWTPADESRWYVNVREEIVVKRIQQNTPSEFPKELSVLIARYGKTPSPRPASLDLGRSRNVSCLYKPVAHHGSQDRFHPLTPPLMSSLPPGGYYEFAFSWNGGDDAYAQHTRMLDYPRW
jgi:hypothetical protein